MLYWGWRDTPEPAAHLQNKTICSLVAGAGGGRPGDNRPVSVLPTRLPPLSLCTAFPKIVTPEQAWKMLDGQPAIL